MLDRKRLRALLFGLAVISSFLFGAASARAQQQYPYAPAAPVVPATSTGSYTVQFTPGQGAYATLLEERVGTNGPWVQISAVQYSGGYYYAGFNKPDGTYFYRAVALIPTYYGGPPYYTYSGASSVVVTVGPPPPHDPMSNQRAYTYEARVGDINADDRPDVFVRRTSGGVAGNGALGEAILRRLPDGSFSAGVLNSTQLAAAANWPVLNTTIELNDFNLDGFVNVLLPNLGSAIAGALGQVIVSPGQMRVLAPQRVIPMDTKFNRFMSEVGSWIQESNYFDANAPLVVRDIWILEWRCPYDVIYGEYVACEYYEVWGGYQIFYDYGVFDQDALSFSRLFRQVVNGILKPTIIPGSGDGVAIDNLMRSVFGVSMLRGILGNNCYDYEYDPITHLPCFDLGPVLLASLLEFKRDAPRCRSLTINEMFLVDQYVDIWDLRPVQICNYTVGILGEYFGTPWVAPNGNIYVTSNWREDYSLARALQPGNRSEMLISAQFMRMMVYVFYSRMLYCEAECLTALYNRAVQQGGPNYTPIEPRTTETRFFCRNIQQQAEMVGDFFLRTYGQPARLDRNQVGAPTLDDFLFYVSISPRSPIHQLGFEGCRPGWGG